jgi:hypothetical protein
MLSVSYDIIKVHGSKSGVNTKENECAAFIIELSVAFLLKWQNRMLIFYDC